MKPLSPQIVLVRHGETAWSRSGIRATAPGWNLWRDGAPEGETAEQAGARADRVVEEVRQVAGNVLLFSHGHFLRLFAARWLGLPPSEGRLFALSTASISVLGWNEAQPILVSWNDTTHLRPEFPASLAVPLPVSPA
jgi:probable phosphoglycerate mutase